MDISNPELYEKLQAYIKLGEEGLNEFEKAQCLESNEFLNITRTATGLNTVMTSPNLSPLYLNKDNPYTSALSTNNTNWVEGSSLEGENVHINSSSRRNSISNIHEEYPPSSQMSSPQLAQPLATPYSVEGLGYVLLRGPILLFVLLIIGMELAFYTMVRQFVAFWEYLYVWRGKLRKLRKELNSAETYDEWKEVALKMDTHMRKDQWRKQPQMAQYDHQLISNMRDKIKLCRKRGKLNKLVEILLQAGLRNNIGNIDSVRLYSHTYYGTKEVVEDFLDEVMESLDYIGTSKNLSIPEKKRFFKDAFRSYGRSALCLSGGATLAYFHFGVVRTLLDSNMLPKIITGTSAGSMVAALVACRTDDELRELLIPDVYILINACEEPFLKMGRLISEGSLFAARDFASKSQWVTKGHTTFLEAYKNTGKILNITVVPYNSYGPAKILNYISAPDVVIWSAVLASSSIPGVLEPITLMAKNQQGKLEPYLGPGVKWRDGSIKTDIPIDALNSFFNVKYSIVSQANPHIAIFYYENRGSVGRPAAHRQGKGWRGGFLAAALEHYLKLDLKKWLRVIRDLELLPFIAKQDFSNLWLQKFDGNVTILPFLRYRNYLNIFRDPDLFRMKDYFRTGTVKTWPKLHMIDNRTKIERKIFFWLNTLYTKPKSVPISGNYTFLKGEPNQDIPEQAPILANGQPERDEISTDEEQFLSESANQKPELAPAELESLMELSDSEEE